LAELTIKFVKNTLKIFWIIIVIQGRYDIIPELEGLVAEPGV